MRVRNIDFLKGLLIVLVVIGHILQGSLSTTFARYFIYFFHMPLFIGIGGFLFNYVNSRKVSLKQLINKYLFRAIVPWIVAVLIYTLLFDKEQFTLQQHGIGFFRVFLFPYIHLWFIPAFLSWICLSWVFAKLKIQPGVVVIVSGIISLLSYLLHIYPEFFPRLQRWQPVNVSQFTLRPWFYVFFAFGMYLKQLPMRYRHISQVCLYVTIPLAILLFFYPITSLSVVVFFMLNIALIDRAIYKTSNDSLPHSTAIEWLGANSLAIYLWHFLPISLLIGWLGTSNLSLFYAVAFPVEIISILLLYQLSKIKVINSYLFGMG